MHKQVYLCKNIQENYDCYLCKESKNIHFPRRIYRSVQKEQKESPEKSGKIRIFREERFQDIL